MLAVGLQQAKLYSKRPCLLAKDMNDESKDVYWVEDASLPCLSCKDNPLSLVSQKQMFALQKKYRVPARVMKKIQNFYKSDREMIDLKGDTSLGAKIMVQEIENTILSSLKRKYRDPNSQLLPYYDPELSGRIALHTSVSFQYLYFSSF